LSRSPFDALQSNKSTKADTSPSGSRLWTGRVAFIHKDARGRLKFLFDVIPLSGWPSPTENVGGATITAGQSAPQRGIPRVRMLQPFVSALRDTTTPATGIIAVPTVGSIVTVAPDETGWVIIGFQTGPVIPLDGTQSRLAEAGYNPGIEEASSTLVDNSGVPWLLGIEEGDVLLGRGDSRVKLNSVGVFVGSGPSCLHVYKTDGSWLYERYAQFERRAPGRLSYHKFLPGVASSVKNSFVDVPVPDALVINTDIIESSPHLGQNRPYVVRQTGLVTESTLGLGRKAGEVLPLPTEIANASTTEDYTVIRESVIQPTAAPTGTAADSNELTTTSHVVFDYQVGADGSFHIRAGNVTGLPGASVLGDAGRMDLEIAYDAKSQVFKIELTGSGSTIAKFEIDAQAGAMNLSALKSINLKAPNVTIESDVALKLKANGKLELNSGSPMTISSPNLNLSTAGELKALLEITAGVIALTKHKHLYTSPSGQSITPPPMP
jgi:hypothetical protein